jgi:ribosomal protein S18 acetylase RimI-like enzyme
MVDYKIRPARPDEADAVLEFWRAAAEGTSISDDPAGVRTLIERDPEALLLALETDQADQADHVGVAGAERVVGTVIAGIDGWRCHLYRLAVAPDRRRRGIGSALLDAAHRRFETCGGRRADAMVLERNETGRRAWTAAGYQREDQWRRWVKPLA